MVELEVDTPLNFSTPIQVCIRLRELDERLRYNVNYRHQRYQ